MHPATQLLLNAVQLKQIPRSGWVHRGVPQPESVAAHSWGASLTAMLLAELIDRPFNMARLLSMVILHDLPEAMTGDIASPVKRFFPGDPEELKHSIERSVMAELTANVAFGGAWRDLWEEMIAQETPEAQLVKDVDVIDMMAQCLTYEQQTGNRLLKDFWNKPRTFYFDESHQIYEQLVTLRAA